MYSWIISSVIVPEETAKYPRAHKCLPQNFFRMRKLLQQHPGAYPLDPLHNRADVLVRPIGQEHMNMILRHLPRQNHKLVFPCYLPDQISHSKCDLSVSTPLQYLGIHTR